MTCGNDLAVFIFLYPSVEQLGGLSPKTSQKPVTELVAHVVVFSQAFGTQIGPNKM